LGGSGGVQLGIDDVKKNLARQRGIPLDGIYLFYIPLNGIFKKD
jgi:hypothetical protein